MKNKYDNALTRLSLDKEETYDEILSKLIEACDKLIDIEKNSHLISEEKRMLMELTWWDKAKYFLSKAGRYKAGGKIFGKKAVDDEANEKILQIMSKKDNEVLKKLHDQIQELNKSKDSDGKPGRGTFPNNEDPQIFLTIIIAISAVYDSIVGATKKDKEDKEFLPVDMANKLIIDLRGYVKKYLDVDLKWTGSILDQEEEKNNIVSEDEESDLRAKLKGKVGDDAEKIGSQRMDTLKSNKLPLTLLASGLAAMSLSWLAQTDWLRSLLESWLNTPGQEGSDAVYDTITGDAGDRAEGWVHWARQIDPSNPVESGGDVQNFITKFGEENVSHMFDGNGAGPTSIEQVGQLQELVSGDGASSSVGELFQSDTFGDMKGGRNLFGVSKAATFVSKVLVKAAVKGVAAGTVGTVLAVNIAAVGAVLLPIGIALVTTGALVKLMRIKGQSESRGATLNLLLQSLQKVKPTEKNIEVIDIPDPDPIPGPEPDDDQEGEGGDDKPPVPPDFLKGNRNMQLSHLSKLFLPKGEDFWSKLGLKDGTKIPSGFLDAALAQGGGKRNLDSEKYLDAYYDHLVKKGSFTTQIDKDEWVNTILKEPDHLALIRWIRNTRKGIGGFLNALRKAFPKIFVMDKYTTDSGVDMMTPAAQRMKATTSRPGKEGESMGTAGPVKASIDKKDNLLLEVGLGKVAGAAGFKGDLFMKNLPEFMSMLSAMYYSAKGTPLEYNKEAVMDECKPKCKDYSGKTYEKTKSGDYHFQGEKGYRGKTEKTEGILHKSELTEEIKRIKILMQ